MTENKEDIYLRRARNIFLLERFNELAKLAQDNGIKLIALKGISYLNTLYTDPGIRDLGDIDVLVQRKDVLKMISILETLSYHLEGPKLDPKELNSDYLNSVVLKKESSVSYFVHLHWSLQNTSLPLTMFNFDMQKIFSDARINKLNGVEFYTLKTEHEFLYMTFHAFVHSYDRVSLLEDMQKYLKKYKGDIDLKYVIREATSFKLLPCLYIALTLLKENFNEEIFDEIKLKMTVKQKEICNKFCLALEKGCGTQNLVMPIYLSMLESRKERFRFLLRTLFPAQITMKRIYREEKPQKILGRYNIRLKNAFVQFKTLLGRYLIIPMSLELRTCARTHKFEFIRIVFLQTIAMAFALSVPLAVKFMVESFLNDGSSEKVIYSSMMASGLYILSLIFQSCANYYRRSIRVKIRNDISDNLFDKCLRQDLERTVKQSSGSRVYELVQDCDRFSDFVVSFIADSCHLIPKFILLALLLCFFDFVSAILIFLLALIVSSIAKVLSLKMQHTYSVILNKEAKLSSYLHQLFRNIFLVKIFKAEDYETLKYAEINKDYYKSSKDNIYLETIHAFFSSSSGRISLIVILLISLLRIKSGMISLGDFSAAFVYLMQLAFMQNTFILLKHKIALGKIAHDRIVGAGLCVRPFDENIVSKNVTNNVFQDRADTQARPYKISIKNICFAYKSKNVFENFSIDIKEGFTVITGPSGVGKSTLLKLIMGLITPKNGEIHYPVKSLESVKMVPQELMLWNDTVINNIAYARAGVSVEEVFEASKIANADSFIKDLPESYSTLLDPEAANLSIGQKQKISLARALVSKPEILLIDETFSSFDEKSEKIIFQNLRQLSWLKYVIVVSHRRSTISLCDHRIEL